MILLLDNYDSFTWNLYHYLGELGAQVEVRRNDHLTVAEALGMHPDAIVISPGPCDPDRAGISVALVKAAAGTCPILGVCLGHQSIAQAFGARIERAPAPMHGKVDQIEHDGTGLFQALESPLVGTRYHSLCALQSTVPELFAVNAFSPDGVVMGIRHRQLPIHGLQFHPESIATTHGHQLLRNFLTVCRADVAA